MMSNISPASACIIIASSLLLFHILKLILTRRRFTRFAAAHNCALPATKHLILPFGAEQLLAFLTFKGDFLDQVTGRGFKRAKAWTHAVSVPLQSAGKIITADPQNVQAVLATRFEDWEMGGNRRAHAAPLIGQGILTADGQAWAAERKMIRPLLAREQISDLELLERHVQELLRVYIGGKRSGWSDSIDGVAPVFCYTLDTHTDFLLGASADSQTAMSIGTESLHETGSLRLSQAWFKATPVLVTRASLGSLYWVLDYHIPFRRACTTVAVETRRLVGRGLRSRTPDAGTETEKEQMSTSSHGWALRRLAQFTQDPEVLRQQLMHLLLGGHDTTAGALSWALINLARTPGAWEKLRSEVLDTIGPYETSRCGEDEAFNLNSLKSCRYLHQAIQETLRLQPPISINTRRAVRDTVLPSGGGAAGDQPVAVQKGSTIILAVYEMHRREDLWGADAKTWRPERWQGLRPSWNFIAFHGGPRRCPGGKLHTMDLSNTKIYFSC